MSARLAETWAWLAQAPLAWLAATLCLYAAAERLHRRLGRTPLAHPALVAMVVLAVALQATGTPYPRYLDGARVVHFLLGPATVALALPLHRELRRARARAVPLTAALLAGSVTAIVTAVAVARLFGAPRDTVLSLAPKSVTTPVAIGIAEKLGGVPSLAAAIVIVTGLVGALGGPALLRRLRVTDPPSVGFAMGVAAHGFGTARAFELGETAGAFSGLGMGLNAVVTAGLLPVLASFLYP